MPCLVAKPIVDGIEKDLKGSVQLIRFNTGNAEGKKVASDYGVRGLPAMLILDGNGEVVERHSGVPGRKKMVAAALAA